MAKLRSDQEIQESIIRFIGNKTELISRIRCSCSMHTYQSYRHINELIADGLIKFTPNKPAWGNKTWKQINGHYSLTDEGKLKLRELISNA